MPQVLGTYTVQTCHKTKQKQKNMNRMLQFFQSLVLIFLLGWRDMNGTKYVLVSFSLTRTIHLRAAKLKTKSQVFLDFLILAILTGIR